MVVLLACLFLHIRSLLVRSVCVFFRPPIHSSEHRMHHIVYCTMNVLLYIQMNAHCIDVENVKCVRGYLTHIFAFALFSRVFKPLTFIRHFRCQLSFVQFTFRLIQPLGCLILATIFSLLFFSSVQCTRYEHFV